jgi:hypothetical protein
MGEKLNENILICHPKDIMKEDMINHVIRQIKSFIVSSLFSERLLQCRGSEDVHFFSMARQPPLGHNLLIIETSRSHTGTPQSVGLL